MNQPGRDIHILLVEDTELYIKLVTSILSQIPHVIIHPAKTLQEGVRLLDQPDNHYDLALVDLNLPDAPQGAFVEETCKRGLTSIVFSGVLDAQLKLELFQKGIIDFIHKGSPVALHYLKEIITFIVSQKGRKVLVVNNDSQSLSEQVRMIENLKMEVFACKTEQEALEYTQRNPDLSLALVSENLDGGDAIRLVNELRKTAGPSRLAIIAIPNPSTKEVSEYLRNGANDFLRMPYSQEEFQCRIRNAIKLQQHMEELKKAATHDYLTKIMNRRAFFDTSKPVLAAARRKKFPIALVMMDVDHFKSINDTYGHDVGDEVLQKIASTLQAEIRETDILARFGGEEFVLLMPDIAQDTIPEKCTRIQKALKNIAYASDVKNKPPTMSFGVTTDASVDVDEMIAVADKALYEAKDAGRNQFIIV